MKKDSEWNSREVWKKLDTKGKIQYFKDYYLISVIGVLAAVIMAGLLVYHIVSPKNKCMLYVAVYDLTLDTNEVDNLRERFSSEIGNGITPGQIIIDDSFRSNSPKDMERLQVLVANHSVDAVIANEEIIKVLAGYGYFADLSNVIDKDKLENLKRNDKVYIASGFDDDMTDESIESDGCGKGEKLPYSLKIDESEEWKKLAGNFGDYCCFSLVSDSLNQSNAEVFLVKMLREY